MKWDHFALYIYVSKNLLLNFVCWLEHCFYHCYNDDNDGDGIIIFISIYSNNNNYNSYCCCFVFSAFLPSETESVSDHK